MTSKKMGVASVSSTKITPIPSPLVLDILTVTSSNTLLRSYYSELNSVMIMRLFTVVAGQIKRDDEDFQAYHVPFTMLIGDHTTGGQYYKMINNITDDAMRVIVSCPESENRLAKYSLFNKCVLDSRENVLEVSIHPDLKPFLLNLKSHFTQIHLKEFLRLPSVYSQRLFQLLSSWRKQPYWRTSLDYLHNALCSSPSMRKDFKEFRVHALNRAQRDICNNTSLYFRYEIEKVGLKVKNIIFFFEPEDEAAKQEKVRQETQNLQSKSNKCFESLMKKNRECVPKKKSKVCIYCLSRGRKSLDQVQLWDEQAK